MSTARLARIAAAALLLAAAPTHAQQSAANVFKGKVVEGLYEVKSEIDLTGVPGVPREQQKSSESRNRCVTRQEIEQGVSAGGDCSVTKYTESAGGARILMACKDGKASDMKFTFSPEGFTSETSTTGKEDGKPFVSVFRTHARRLGPCPAAAPAGKAPPGKAPPPK
jgi:hypothetical protein